MKRLPPILEGFKGILVPFKEIINEVWFFFTGRYRCPFCDKKQTLKDGVNHVMLDVSGTQYRMCDTCHKDKYGWVAE